MNTKKRCRKFIKVIVNWDIEAKMMDNIIYSKLLSAVKSLEDEMNFLLQKLIRIPSVNEPPTGSEKAVQEFLNNYLNSKGIESRLIYPADIPAFAKHPARLQEHDMNNRPNVLAKIEGSGSGRSLMILAHADTEPVGDLADWDDDPFSGKIENGCIYGRGSGDDKCGMAIAAMLPLILQKSNLNLQGDLIIASVSDEEKGGGNGSAAILACDIKADAVLYLDGSNQTAWNTALGGGFAKIIIEASTPEELNKQIKILKKIIIDIKAERKEAIMEHPDFGEGFFNCSMEGFFHIGQSRISSQIEEISFFIDTLPGDDEEILRNNVENKLNLKNGNIVWMSRFLKPVPIIENSHPFLANLVSSFFAATGREMNIGPGRQSDQGLINYFGNMPCLIFGCGRRGLEGAPHLPNEYILIKELNENLLTTAFMLANWCGVEMI